MAARMYAFTDDEGRYTLTHSRSHAREEAAAHGQAWFWRIDTRTGTHRPLPCHPIYGGPILRYRANLNDLVGIIDRPTTTH